MRTFTTGATRDAVEDKPQYEGYLSPLVIRRYGAYMLKHQQQSDGALRASNNWQKGIPRQVYMDSMWRHFLDVWLEHDGYESREGLEEALMGLLFNVMGYAYEVLKHEKA